MKRLLILGVLALVGCKSNPYTQENNYSVTNDTMNIHKKHRACSGNGGLFYDTPNAGSIICGNGVVIHYDDWSKEVLY